MLVRKLWVILSLAALSFHPASARADADTDEIALTMLKAAGEGALREIGYEAARYLGDLGLQAASVPASQLTGTEAVAWARLGLATHDFIKAKTDKERAMSGLDVAAAGTAIACPPCGAVAGAAVLVIKLVDLASSVAHAKRMMELQKQIIEYALATARSREARANADFSQLNYLVEQLKSSRGRVEASTKKLKAGCGNPAAGLPVERLEECVNAIADAYPAIADFIAYSEQLAVTGSEFFDETKKNETGRNFQDYRASVDKTKQQFRETRTQAQQAFATITKMIARAAVEKALAQGSLDLLWQQRQHCYEQGLEFVRKANLTILRAVKEQAVEARTQLAEIYYGGRSSFDEAGCREFIVVVDGQTDPLLEVLAARERTLRRVEDYLQRALDVVGVP